MTASPANPMTMVDAVRRAVEYEMTLGLGDFLFRRTTLGYTDRGNESLLRGIADEMQRRLGWSEEEKARQIGRLKMEDSG